MFHRLHSTYQNHPWPYVESLDFQHSVRKTCLPQFELQLQTTMTNLHFLPCRGVAISALRVSQFLQRSTSICYHPFLQFVKCKRMMSLPTMVVACRMEG